MAGDDVIASRGRSPLTFFCLTFALSIPFLLISAATGIELLPRLPVAALMTVCPVAAALILVYREDKTAGVVVLLKRSFDCKRIGSKAWYAPVLLLMPATMALSYGLMRLLGVPLPSPSFSALPALALFAVFFIAALGEELGWSGYVLYNNTGKSVFAAALFHATINVTWMLFPVRGSYFDPRVVGLIMTVVAAVVSVWGPRPLFRSRNP